MDGIQPEDAAYMGRMRERKDRRMNQLPSEPNPGTLALSIICSCSNHVPLSFSSLYWCFCIHRPIWQWLASSLPHTCSFNQTLLLLVLRTLFPEWAPSLCGSFLPLLHACLHLLLLLYTTVTWKCPCSLHCCAVPIDWWQEIVTINIMSLIACCETFVTGTVPTPSSSPLSPSSTRCTDRRWNRWEIERDSATTSTRSPWGNRESTGERFEHCLTTL